MRSLFGRIFLWFCATVFCGILLTIIVGPYLERPREMDRIQGEIRHLTTLAGTTLVDLYEREGRQALKQQLNMERMLLKIYVFDAGGNELSERPVPDEIRQLMSPDAQPPMPPGPMPQVLSLRSSSGSSYRVAFLPAHPPSKTEFLISRLADGRLPLFLIAGVVFSFLLAHSLTAPLRRLRTTVKSVGRGDLSARTGGGSRWGHKEIGDLAREFDRMAVRVETLVDGHKRLLRDISHELRSPLTRINVALDLARKRCGESAANSLASIATDAARMESLIDQMLTISRLDVLNEKPPDELVNLGALVINVIRDADIEAHDRGVHINMNAIPPVLIRGVWELLRRAVENVIRNALVYAPRGSEITVNMDGFNSGDTAMVALVVRDRGKGVPDDNLDSIFEPYYRMDTSGTGKGSMGLGLAITRRAVQLHGGTVTAANAKDGGLEVTISLPAMFPPRENLRPA